MYPDLFYNTGGMVPQIWMPPPGFLAMPFPEPANGPENFGFPPPQGYPFQGFSPPPEFPGFFPQ